jgi:HPt (histidine-containing phosphotransfer) domain-containing protein
MAMHDLAKHLDLDAIKNLRDVMGDEFGALLDTFFQDSVHRLALIADAVASGEPDSIRKAAHSFKGSASNMGAMTLANLCRQLEMLAREGQLQDVQVLQKAIASEYHKVKEALASL